MSDPPVPTDASRQGLPGSRTIKVAAAKGEQPIVISLKAKAPPPTTSGHDPVAILTGELSRIASGNPQGALEGTSGHIVRVVQIALRETRTPAPSGSTKLRAAQTLGGVSRQNSGWADDAVAGGQTNLHWRFVDGGEPFSVRPAGSNQLGHFLTGLGHRLSAAAMVTDDVMAADIGHELIKGDGLAIAAGTPFVPIFKTALSNMDNDPKHIVDLRKLDVDLAPAIDQYVKQVLIGSLNPIVNPFDPVKNPGGITDAGKEGFSVQDLRLTAMSWRLGGMVMSGAFGGIDELNTWLQNNLSTQAGDPESGAPAPANPSGPLLNDLDFKTKP